MDKQNSILDVGFLSPEVSHYMAEHRTKYAVWFEFAERVNRKGQKLLSEAKVTIDEAGTADPKFLAFLLLIRTLSNFQAIILLIERGMAVEARTMARSCYENMFCLVSLQKFGAEFVTKMLNDDLASRKATANWLLQKEKRLEYAGADAAKRLREAVYSIDANSDAIGRHVFEQIAEKADIGDMYMFYRQLSWDAAHPSLNALNRYLIESEESKDNQLRWGPDCISKEVGDTLNICLPAMFATLIAAREMVVDATPDADLTMLWHEYLALIEVDTTKAA